jgi:DNA-binding transcriptional ArsR family regulator
MGEVQARLDALEARVQALEAAAGVGSRPAPQGRPESEADERFWALSGLQERLADLPAGHDGAVLFTGSVELAGGHVEWQIGATTSDLVDSDWSEHSDTLTALGHPVRLRLLQAVATGAHTLADLQELPGLGTSGQIYHHLRALTGAGWLRAGTRGRWSVPPERLVPLLVVIAAARR